VTVLRRRGGFTLLEVILAVSLVGAAILGGVLLLDQLNDGAARIVAEGAATDRASNGDRLLHHLIFEAHASADTNRKFAGDDRSASFRSRCEVPAGWLESCDVTLAVDDRGDSSAVVADLSLGGSLVLRRDAGRWAWRYLDTTPRDTAWATHWASGTTLPAALALISASDTIVLPVQVRRD
jgi:prepilin-type N-terminal cleavage/methylation domain-containing protein